MSNFIAKSIPLERVENITLNSGYSAVYCAERPVVPIVGNWAERKCCLNDSFLPILERIYNFEVRDDDVWVLTNPKCGTTWMQELTWLVTNNFDFETAKGIDLDKRSPFLDYNGFSAHMPIDTLELLKNTPSPRIIKSHLPTFLLPAQLWTKKPKIIYVFRDPKDAAISYYHHTRTMIEYKGTKEEFLHLFIDGCITFCPFWPHVLDFWHLRNDPQVFFTSYEYMKGNLPKIIKNICTFLKKPVTEELVAQAVAHLSFDSMKQNPQVSHEKYFAELRNVIGKGPDDFRFVRRGIVGSHKDEMSAELINKFDVWTRESLAPYEIEVQDIINYSKF